MLFLSGGSDLMVKYLKSYLKNCFSIIITTGVIMSLLAYPNVEKMLVTFLIWISLFTALTLSFSSHLWFDK